MFHLSKAKEKKREGYIPCFQRKIDSALIKELEKLKSYNIIDIVWGKPFTHILNFHICFIIHIHTRIYIHVYKCHKMIEKVNIFLAGYLFDRGYGGSRMTCSYVNSTPQERKFQRVQAINQDHAAV